MNYKGTIQRLDALKGKIREKLSGLKVQISKVRTAPTAKIKPITSFSGEWYKHNYFSGTMKILNALFRFLFAKSRIIQKHEAKASSSPAVEIQADSTFRSGKEAPLASHPAKGIAVDQKERLSVSAKLVAYRRAGCRYIKKLFFKTTAKLQAASSAVANYSKAVKLKRTSKAIAAESAIIESRFNKVQTGVEAAGRSATAHIVPEIESTVTAEHTATASTGTAVGVGINQLFHAVHRAPLASWFFPEQDGDTLRFYQVFSGVQSGNVLEIDLETESAFWANAKVTDGTLNLVFAQTEPQTNNELKVI